jgi:hypothetical protein
MTRLILGLWMLLVLVAVAQGSPSVHWIYDMTPPDEMDRSRIYTQKVCSQQNSNVCLVFVKPTNREMGIFFGDDAHTQVDNFEMRIDEGPAHWWNSTPIKQASFITRPQDFMFAIYNAHMLKVRLHYLGDTASIYDFNIDHGWVAFTGFTPHPIVVHRAPSKPKCDYQWSGETKDYHCGPLPKGETHELTAAEKRASNYELPH